MKNNMIALRTALLGTFLTASTAALADPTTLICNNEIFPNLPPTTFNLDEANHTVSTDYQGLGQIAAAFDPQKISFVVVQGTETEHYTIDRLTGNVSMITDSGIRAQKIFTCHVGQRQF